MHENLAKEVEDLKLKVETLEKKIFGSEDTTSETKGSFTTSLDMARELEERKYRSCNAVFYGLPISNDPMETVSKACKESLKMEMDVRATIKKVWVLKSTSKDKVPLVIARFASPEARDNVLQAARKRPFGDVKKSGLYVNPDLTKMERDARKQLKAELRLRHDAGEKVAIRGLRIVAARH